MGTGKIEEETIECHLDRIIWHSHSHMSFDMDVNSMQITIIAIEKLDFYFIATTSVARKIETDENTMYDL